MVKHGECGAHGGHAGRDCPAVQGCVVPESVVGKRGP